MYRKKNLKSRLQWCSGNILPELVFWRRGFSLPFSITVAPVPLQLSSPPNHLEARWDIFPAVSLYNMTVDLPPPELAALELIRLAAQSSTSM